METKELYEIPTTDVVRLRHRSQILTGSEVLYDRTYLYQMEEEEDI